MPNGRQLLVSFEHGNRAVWHDRKTAEKALARGTARALTAAERDELNAGDDRHMTFPDEPAKPKAKAAAKKASS